MTKMMWLFARIMGSLVLQSPGNLGTKETAPRSQSPNLEAWPNKRPSELQPLHETAHNRVQDKYDATTKFQIHTVLKPMPTFSDTTYDVHKTDRQGQVNKREERAVQAMWKWIGVVPIPEEVRGEGTKYEVAVELGDTTLCKIKTGEEELATADQSCQIQSVTGTQELSIEVNLGRERSPNDEYFARVFGENEGKTSNFRAQVKLERANSLDPENLKETPLVGEVVGDKVKLQIPNQHVTATIAQRTIRVLEFDLPNRNEKVLCGYTRDFRTGESVWGVVECKVAVRAKSGSWYIELNKYLSQT